MSLFRFLMTCLLVIFAASCTYKGGVENPVTRKFTWFSYVNGDDIRKACATLGADRYRFVYNGIYQQQHRSYDISFLNKKMSILVAGESNLRKLNLSDLAAPWRGESAELFLKDKELQVVRKAVVQSGALQKAPLGLRLYSDHFFWTVAACVDGKFHFNAYLWPSDRWENMQFDDLLFALDVSGVEVAQPKRYSPVDIWESNINTKPFLMEVGENGLVGFEGG